MTLPEKCAAIAERNWLNNATADKIGYSYPVARGSICLKRLFRSTLLRTTVAYWGIAAFSGVLSFLTIPILTRTLTPEDYGIIGFYTIIQVLIFKTFSFGAVAAISREYFTLKTDRVKDLMSTGILFFLAVGAVITILMIPSLGWVSRASGVPEIWLSLIGLSCTLAWTVSAADWVARAKVWPHITAALSMGGALVDTIGSCLLVAVFHWGFHGRLFGALLALIYRAGVALLLLHSLRLLRGSFSIPLLTGIIGLGAPLVIYSLTEWGLYEASALILRSTHDIGALGLLTVAISISNGVYLVQNGLSQSVSPWIMARLADGSQAAHNRIGLLTGLIDLSAAVVVATTYIALKILFPFLVGPNFAGVLPLLPWILVARYFTLIMVTRYPVYLYLGRTKTLTVIAIIACAFAVPTTFMLVKVAGALGAAIGNALGFALFAGLSTLYLRKLIHIDYLSGLARWPWLIRLQRSKS